MEEEIKEKSIEDGTSKIHKLEESKVNNLRVWKQKQNTLSDGIIQKISHNKRVVKEALNNILGEDNEDIIKNKINNLKNNSTLKISSSSKNLDLVSKNAKKILKKVNLKIKKIKDSSEDIIAMNALFLDNKIFPYKTNKNKRYNNSSSLSLPERIKFANTPNAISANKSQDNNNTLEENNYSEGIKKKNRRNNFLFVNNNYRKQLNQAFMKFNPSIYLNNLKVLLQVSPSIREDVTKTKNEVEEDIKALCDKHRYSKKLNAFLSKKNRSQSVENCSPNIYKSNDNISKKAKLIINTNMNPNPNFNFLNKNSNSPKEENNSSFNNNKPTFSFLPKITKEKILGSSKEMKVGFGLFEKLKRKETQRILNMRDQKIEEAGKIFEITNEIENLIGTKNIGEKVDKYINDYRLEKYLSQLRDNEFENKIRGKDYYKPQKLVINELFGELYINKLEKKAKEKEKYYNDRIRRDKNDYFLKIGSELKKSLNEFDNNIILNQIDLNPQDPNNENSEDLLRQSLNK